MTKHVPTYILWAFCQHSMALAATWFVLSPYWAIFIAYLLFVLLHLPNWRLMQITAVGGAVMYLPFMLLFYVFGHVAFLWWVPACVGHAIVGHYVALMGVEMRVLWMYPKK